MFLLYAYVVLSWENIFSRNLSLSKLPLGYYNLTNMPFISFQSSFSYCQKWHTSWWWKVWILNKILEILFFFNLIQPTIPPYFRLGQKILLSKIHQITAETESKNFTEICDYCSYSFQYFVGKLSISDCLYKFFYQVSMLFRVEGIIWSL